MQATLQRLMQHQPPLVAVLPRQPGTKEARYAHLLSGEVQSSEAPAEPRSFSASAENDGRMARLEQQVSELQQELAELKQELSNFRKQFES